MSCDVIVRGDLEAYAFGELSGRAAQQVEAHLRGCGECAAELRVLRAERRLFRSRAEAVAAEVEVPSFESVLARIDATPAAPAVVAASAAPSAARSEVRGEARGERIRPVRFGRAGAVMGLFAAAAAAAWLWWGGPQPVAETQADADDRMAPIVSEAVCLRDDPEHEVVEEARAAASEAALASVEAPLESRRTASVAVASVGEELSACSQGSRVGETRAGDGALMTPSCESAVDWCSLGRP